MTVFRNANVIDGTGNKTFRADIVISNDTIEDILEPNSGLSADKSVDASGKILCPGFMDIHAHSELEVLRDSTMAHKINQGITFDLSGNCGVGAWPRKIDDKPAFADILGHCSLWDWTDFSSYSDKVKCGINMGFLQNHAMLRMAAINGNPNRSATKDEVKTMCNLLDTALDQGCYGFSSGLYYAPNIFADRYEIEKLLEIVKKHNALFTVHHRCEGDEIISSIEEVLSYVRNTGVRLEISHLKTIGKENGKKADTVLAMIHRAKDEGFDVAFDQYPYPYGSTSLFSLLPPSYLRLQHEDLLEELKEACTDNEKKQKLINEMENPDGWDSLTKLCGFENITAVILESSPSFNGLTLTQCAEKLKTDCYTALFHLLSKETKCALMIDTTQSQQTIAKIMTDPLMSFGTDALYAGSGAHPRSGNAAIHLLDTYCKQQKILTFEQAIEKMTSKVAKRLGIENRGIIAKGYKADIVVFDPVTLKDNSTPSDPYAKCTGLEHVMVNGVFALKNTNLTGSLSGCVLKNQIS